MRAPHGGWSGRGERPGRVGCLKWRRRETAGKWGRGQGRVKVGISLAEPSPQTVPAAPQPRLSEGGFRRQLPRVSRDPNRVEAGETTPLCRPSTGVRILRPSSADFFPHPHSAWVWRLSPEWRHSHLDRRGGGDARFQRLAPRGRAEVAGLASSPSGVAVSWRL